MNEMLKDLIDTGVLVFLDDILIYGETKEEVWERTREVLWQLRKEKLFVKIEKCKFKVEEVSFLGFILGGDTCEWIPVK